MGLIFRRTFRGPGGTSITASQSGLTASKRFGPLTINSRGHVTLRLMRGISWRIF